MTRIDQNKEIGIMMYPVQRPYRAITASLSIALGLLFCMPVAFAEGDEDAETKALDSTATQWSSSPARDMALLSGGRTR